MIELLAGAAAILALLLIVAVVYAFSYRDERNEALQDLTIARGDIRALNNRVIILSGDKIAQQVTIDMLRAGHDELVDARDQVKRELGRLKAERVAEKISEPARHPEGTIAFTPKRGKNGQFLAKPKAPKPAKPIACG